MGDLTKTDKTRIELWTARDMVFMLDKKRGQGKIPRFTSCVKPVYTQKIKWHIERMEKMDHTRPSGVKAVCVKLEGTLRYVWRTDVLTKEEYDAARAKERTSLGALRSKPRGTLGEGTEDTDRDQSSVAASLPDGEREGPDA